MYDSRTHKPRLEGTHRYLTRDLTFGSWRERCMEGRPTLTRAEAIAEQMADMAEPEQVEHRFSQAYINRQHAEALRMHDEWFAQEMEEAWAWLDAEMDRQQAEVDWLGGESDLDSLYESDFLPLMTTAEAREHFGPDWEHSGFQITHQGRPYARTTKEKHMPEDIERAMAQQSVAAQRARIQARTEALVADVQADVKAKVERPEPTPYEKFAGVTSRAPHYDDTLDPISPNFDRSAW